MSHLRENLAVAQMTLSAEVMDELEKIIAES